MMSSPIKTVWESVYEPQNKHIVDTLFRLSIFAYGFYGVYRQKKQRQEHQEEMKRQQASYIFDFNDDPRENLPSYKKSFNYFN